MPPNRTHAPSPLPWHWVWAALALLCAAWGAWTLWGPMPLAKPLPTTGGSSGEVILLQEIAGATALQPLQHRQAQLLGRLQGEHTVMLKGRNMAGQSGAYIVAPLVERNNTGLAILVLRGWVPDSSMKMAQMIQRSTARHDVVIHGRLAMPTLGSAEDAAAERGLLRKNLDLTAFSKETGISMLPLVILEEPETTTSDKDIRGDLFQRRWPELYPQDRYRGTLGRTALGAALVFAAAAVWAWRRRLAAAQPPAEPEWETTR
ncbi:COG3346 Uncharacterized conserved protein [Comamonadaceae bacterium]